MSNDDFLIVGIGASAGGIQAIKRFFQQVPEKSGMAFVVVLHLSPEHESRLAEVLQVSTSIPVAQVRERLRVERDHVYVIPPHQSLSMQDGFLMLSPVAGFEERRAPVDIFFRTLAESHGSRAVCVVLSGTGANGSMGMKRVKEHGGVSFVQDPDEAEYSDMPRNSIASGHVDHVLPVAEIPGRILAYKRSLESVRVPEKPSEQALSDESALREVLTQLRSRTGHDFASYKRPTVLRRIARRLSLHQLPDLQSYAAFLRDHPEELQPLLKDLLISVTNFFRDREAFEALERMVSPGVFADKAEEDHVRVWVPGCATGEEAYSIAMLLSEHAAGLATPASVQIFGTDIDDAALVVAREGLYTANDAADVSPERLRRFFIKEGEHFRVRPELREMILFAKHNIIKDPPFSHLDLISCRNLLIYLNRAAQQHVMEVMHFALNPGGYLFLGSSESGEGSSDLFVTLDKDAHLFQSRAVTTRLAVPMPHLSVPEPRDERAGSVAFPSGDQRRERLSAADIHHRLLEQYAPPSVVVNEDHEIVHLSEHAGRYLQYVAGEPSHNLLKAIRPELRIDVRTALYQAAQQRANVEATGLSLRVDNRAVLLDVLVRPVLREDEPARGFFLLVFKERPESVGPAAEASTPLAAGDTARQLEEEILRLKAQLRATVERHETQAEELKASNEELQAMNEELRSSSEELETSKEELQSLNEELRTVNQELKVKVEEQTQANDDIQNLINSTDIGTIFLDRASRIKLFTPRARDLFTLIPADRGRPLSDISSLLVDADLLRMIERVLDHLERVEREVRSRDDRWYLMRVLPYRTADDRIDGVVITFVDITDRKHTENQLQWSESRHRLIVESVTDYAIFTTDAAGVIDTWNPAAARVFGYADLEALGRSASMLFTREDRERGVPDEEMRRADREGRAADERWHLRRDGSKFFASGVIAPLRDAAGTVTGFVKIARDLTERKRREDELWQAHADLGARVQERTQQLKTANRALDTEHGERRQAEEQVRSLLRRLVTIQEDERRRLSRDLHDQLGQHLAGLGLKLDALAKRGARGLNAGVEDVRRTIGQLDNDLDLIAWELRPAVLDDLGLVVTLDNFVRDWSKEFRIAAEFHSRGLESFRLPLEIETNLYRIVQEALNNVYKHARAHRVGVILERRDDQAVLIVEDDGVGFDPTETDVADRERIGLVGIRERAAIIGSTLEVETAPGRGTTIFVRFPLLLGPPEPSS